MFIDAAFPLYPKPLRGGMSTRSEYVAPKGLAHACCCDFYKHDAPDYPLYNLIITIYRKTAPIIKVFFLRNEVVFSILSGPVFSVTV